MKEALNAAWNQFLKDSEKLPGWVPLLVVTLVVVECADLPQRVNGFLDRFPKVPRASPEFIAGVLTLLFYSIGDALDEIVFKTGSEHARKTRPIFANMYAPERDRAQGDLGVGNGSYAVALKLVEAAEKHRGKIQVHFPNEIAKCLRALIVPLGLAAIAFSLQGSPSYAGWSVIGVLVAGISYPLLKVFHVRRLYSTASELAWQKRYHDELVGTMRLVFWDGTFVGAGDGAPKRASLNCPGV